jgi:hypothetical protein
VHVATLKPSRSSCFQTSSSSLTTNSWVQDPGFEVQGQWIGAVTDAHVIPGVNDLDDLDAQVIYDNYVYST